MVSLRACFPFVLAALALPARAQVCPELGPIQVSTGAGTITCPCFVASEEAGTVFTGIPAGDFPIEITKIGIAWGSQSGGALPTIEDSIVIYGAGLPNPAAGGQLFTLGAPQMTDGFVNEFDVENQGPGGTPITINTQPFTVTLRFANSNNTPPYGPSMVEDNNGITPGRNVVKAVGFPLSGWYDAQLLGVSGDWVVYVKYRAHCGTGGGNPGTAYCFGDGTGAACPCDPGQAGQPGQGCANSTGNGGRIEASGTPSVANDSLVLHLSHLPATAAAIIFQGTVQQNGGNGSQLNDGLLCVNGSIIRIGTKNSVGGASDWGFGVAGDPLISVRGAIPAVGGTRHYQGWYRNSASFCTPATSNYTNGWSITWTP
ncbi:MAG: hypothetical protein U1F29_14975 [Planctomycetota bacterium]